MDDKNRRLLSMIVVAVGIGALYYATTELMGSEGSTDETVETQEAEGVTEAEGSDEGSDDGEATPSTSLSEEERQARQVIGHLRTDAFEADIDNLGGGLRALRITGDERFTEEDGSPLDVVSTDTAQFEQYQSLRMSLGEVELPEDIVWDLTQVSDREVRLTWEGQGLRITRSFLAGQGPYQIWHTVRIANTADYERTTRLEQEVWHWVLRDEESGGIIAIGSRSPAISHGVCIWDEDEEERKDREDLAENVHGYGSGNVHIAAVENVYFTQALAAGGDRAARCSMRAWDIPPGDDADGSLFQAQLIYPWVELDPGEEVSYRTLAYVGPKDRDSLNLAGHHMPDMIDLGFFALIANQLARLLSFIHQYVPNWGLAIILLTLLIRLTLFPLTNLSFKSMAKMRRLKPEMDRINELYKDDAEKKGAATMELYRKHKINPAAGCLPSLVQLPVWWALYTSLSTNIELYHMPFTLWWSDLSSPDPYYVLPVMLGALMHLQQRLSPTSMDATQAKMMMYFMPIMITVFMLFLPSGLCLYMLTNSALGIAQMRLNEHRLQKEVEAAGPLDSDDDDDDGGDDDETEESSSSKPQKRRPRRKRRVRRGRA